MKHLLAIVIAGSIAACCNCNPTAGQEEKLDYRFVNAMRTCAWHMYNVTVSAYKFKNFVFSPLSIQHVMGMIAAGAGGNTEDQLLHALRVHNLQGLGDFDLYEQFRIATKTFFEGKSSIQYPSRLANRIYIEDEFKPKQKYIDTLTNSFKAGEESFASSQPSQTSNSINRWVSERTNGRIKDIASPGDINDNTVMILVNAIFFNAKWKTAFKISSKPMRWYNTQTKPALPQKIQSMETSGEFYYIDERETGMQYFAIPYNTAGLNVYFVIAVPKRKYKHALKDFEQYTSKNLLVNKLPKLKTPQERSEAGWIKSNDKTILKMPTFKFENKIDGVRLMNGLGVTDMFSLSQSNLTGITDSPPLYVSAFKHSATIEVIKEGTTAAAATMAIFMARSLSSGPKIFSVDQAFFFAIYQDEHIIFAGNYYNPPRR